MPLPLAPVSVTRGLISDVHLSVRTLLFLAICILSLLLIKRYSHTVIMATKSRFSADSHGTLTEKSDRDSTTKPSGPNGDFRGDIEVSNKLPSKAELDKAAKLPILDMNGKRQAFGNLFIGESASQKHLIIFVRHFFCGVCSELPFRKVSG